jgi:hypothetical protein
MKKQLNKHTKKHQRGGAESAARASRPSNSSGYTQNDVKEFFATILAKFEDGTSYYAHSNALPKKYFEVDSKVRTHHTIIKQEWHTMVNESYNNRGQTPLYVALRFGATLEMIKMLLAVITDVNRPNIDGSTPLIGLCFGAGIDERVNFQNIYDIINIVVNKGGKLDIINEAKDESALKWLDYKARKKLIDFRY